VRHITIAEREHGLQDQGYAVEGPRPRAPSSLREAERGRDVDAASCVVAQRGEAPSAGRRADAALRLHQDVGAIAIATRDRVLGALAGRSTTRAT